MTTQQKLSSYSVSQVAKHNSLSDAWVVYGNKVFDITEFLKIHPGGDEITLEHLGKDVTDVLNSEILHQHSDNAIQLMTQYCVGELDKKDLQVGRKWNILEIVSFSDCTEIHC